MDLRISNMPKTGITSLTPRQRDCLRLTAELKSSKEIARELSMSQKTVDTHIAAAIKALGAINRRDAARIFLQSGDENAPDKILRQTSRLSDLPTFQSHISSQIDGGTDGPHAVQEQGHGEAPSPPWSANGPSFRTFLEGVKPDDIKPTDRALLIALGAVILALALAITVTFVDVLSRLTDQTS